MEEKEERKAEGQGNNGAEEELGPNGDEQEGAQEGELILTKNYYLNLEGERISKVVEIYKKKNQKETHYLSLEAERLLNKHL